MNISKIRHKWLIFIVLLFTFSLTYALMGNFGKEPLFGYVANDEGEKDSVKNASTTPVKSDSTINLPYKIKPTQDYPYENLEPQSGFRFLKSPSLKTTIEYNPETGQYDVYEKTGAFENTVPYSLTPQEYEDYNREKSRRDYWRTKNNGSEDGTTNGDLLKNVVGNVLGENNPIDIKTQGSAELTFGGKYSRTYNPSLTKRQQRQFNLEFTNKIQASITGKIGDKVSMKVKYDTESQFDFENEMKLEYTGDEDEIIKKIEAGTNISFPIDNSLIKGSQSLRGFKTDLQFGKLNVSSVFSQQRGEFSTINVDKGAQSQEFNIRCDNYEANKHFFMGQYFRNHYEEAFNTMPEVTNGILIRRVEIWMTQTSAGKENARNILAVSGLGDVKSGGRYDLPSNQTDNNYKRIKNLPDVRDISKMSGVMENYGYKAGEDFEKIELAIRLKETQYTINQKLGYISLKSSVDPSKILAIAYEYEYRGKVYQVGEFSSDGVEHPGAIIVKLLKGSRLNPTLSTWDLMMKNVYSLGGYQISGEDFKLDILYEDDKTGKPIGYLPDGKIKGKPLISVMNLDKISTNEQPYPDGYFDYLEGFTVNSQSGLIIFPVLEPFGSHLDSVLGDKVLASKYKYQQLYDSTQSSARQISEKNKFIMKGSYKSSFSSDISLNTTQVQEGSVTVTAGGRKLTEGTDYTVDYAMGRVRIINQSLLESKTPIKVSLESNPLFSMRTKNMIGTKFNYLVNDKFKVGATVLHLSEMPLSTKVGFEDFPINNTVWGLDGTYSTDAPFLTRMVDKIPLINTKEKSTIKTSAEFAQLIPGTSRRINQAVEIDYFENSQQRVSLREPSLWILASTPQGQSKLFPEGGLMNDVRNNSNRAQLSWFDINNDYFGNSDVPEELKANAFAHSVYAEDLFNKDPSSSIEKPITIINLAYYPFERGPYNYDVRPNSLSAGINPNNGRLLSPETRWAGITREMSSFTDFEEANVEYIQFWFMDPYYYDSLKLNRGGDLYFNLGMISEDILRDSKKFAENGLKNDPTKFQYSKLGRSPNFQVIEKGFDNNENRTEQDVGFDGLGDADEEKFFNNYIEELRQYGVKGEIIENLKKDPSHDDFYSYLDERGIQDLPIFERYRYYNGSDGNSPVGNNQGTGRLTPDVEDINQDNTLQETESYFQYRLSLRPEDLVVGKNFIVDKIVEQVDLKDNNNKVKINWYQVKIPINTDQKQRIGNISDFKSIQFMRMFFKNFKDSIYVRMAELALVKSTWRKYDNTIYDAGEYDLNNEAELDLSSVNVEENTNRTPVNYVLPPGVEQTIDPMNTLMTEQNESSLQMKVVGLEDGNAKAVYKMLNKDLRQFGQLKMFVHGEALQGEESLLKDGDVSMFMRLGSDYTQNYYEYEIPLKLTEPGNYESGKPDNSNREKVWPTENNFEIDLKELVKIKEERDDYKSQNSSFQNYQLFTKSDGKNKITLKGNPTLGNVKTILIGVRNKKRSSTNLNDDGQTKSIIVWLDELRLTNFNDKGGWAADASTQITMADFATLSLDGKTIKPGFGGVDEKIFERNMDEINQFNVTSSVALHKFFPEKIGLQLPFYVGWSQMTSTPLYDPLSSDELLKHKLQNMSSDSSQKYKELSQDFESRVSYNFTNVKITKKNPKFLHPLHINNYSLTYAFNKVHDRNVDYEYEDRYDNKLALMYNYTLKPVTVEPFKSIKSQQLALVRDFNVGLLPSMVSFDNTLDKSYKESMRRNLSEYADPSYKFTPIYSKTFNWSRVYNLKWNITKNLKMEYSANNTARIDEPVGLIYHDDSHDAYMKEYRDSVITSIKSGGRTTDFNQKLDLTYKIPIDKITYLNFINSNARYGGNYSWTRGYEIPNSTNGLNAGNIIKNSNTQSIDATCSFTKLYNKSRYLKEVDKRFSGRSNNKPKTENVKYVKDAIEIRAYTPVEIKHGLKTIDVKLSVLDNGGKPIEGKTVVVDGNKITFEAERDYDGAQVIVTGKRDIKDSPWRKVTDGVVHTLIMVKSFSVNASQSLGSYVPGYDRNTQYFGLHEPFGGNSRPGWAYVFGYVPSYDELESTILEKNWLISNDSLLNDKFSRTYSNQLNVKTTIEPLYNFKINFDSKRTFSQNDTRYLSNNPLTMADSKKTTSGSFTISTNAIKTNPLLDASLSDRTYEKFKDNLLIVANRQAAKRGGEYEINPETKFPSYYKSSSQDVLIPAFLAAYTGQDANKIYIDNYFVPLFRNFKDYLRTLNWRINYNGLSDMKFFKKYFKSITISHAYTCNYSINSYQTFTSDNMLENGFYADLVDENVYLAPQYNISAVSVDERFNPILGIDSKLQNNITTKFEIRNNRMVSLSLVNSEISEVGGYEYVVGVGYVFKNFTVNIKTGGSSKSYTNDINTRLDISLRDNTTIRRTIADDVKSVIQGQKIWSVKWFADYMLTQQFTVRTFFDWTINQPRTNGYMTSNKNFGINLRFTLI